MALLRLGWLRRGIFVALLSGACHGKAPAHQGPTVASPPAPSSSFPSPAPSGCQADGLLAAPLARPAPPATRSCGDFAPLQAQGVLGSSEIDEASGLSISRSQEDLLWVHNDSGDGPRVFALTRKGRPRAIYTLSNAMALDWEDMALGPSPIAPGDHLYLGDIGDNFRQRSFITLYRVREPQVPPAQESSPPPTLALTGVEALTFRYPDGPHDAETLMVDPQSGEVFVVTKERSGRSTVFRSPPVGAPSDTPFPLEPIATLTFPGPDRADKLATGGDIASSGDGILIRTYSCVWFWHRLPGMGYKEVFAQAPCCVASPTERQGESVAFEPGGTGYVTVSEGKGAILWGAQRWVREKK